MAPKEIQKASSSSSSSGSGVGVVVVLVSILRHVAIVGLVLIVRVGEDRK